MHILTPVHRAYEVPLLIHAGADWLYTQWLPSWNGNHDRTVSPPTHSIATLFTSFQIEELEEIVQNAHRAGALLFLKLGAAYYTADDNLHLSSLLAQTLATGVDGFIFSDLGVLPFFAESGTNTLLMAGPEIYLNNARALHLLTQAGASHVVFGPRSSLGELDQAVSQGPAELNYGCLIFNGSPGHCFYDPGLCNTIHAGKNFCDWDLEWQITTTYTTEGPDLDYNQSRQLRENEYWHRQWLNPFSYFAEHIGDWRGTGCGLCALPFLIKQSRLSFLQIGGPYHVFFHRFSATALVHRGSPPVAHGAETQQRGGVFGPSLPNDELCERT